ncbi:MAG TPA: glycoside hydrolase family 3 N-terminal domain-containing protein [Bacteroidales bacterium]|nr:glycoside hydrolase family 3 N-terminal domain-containing protein [Bacteroidales bacterium]
MIKKTTYFLISGLSLIFLLYSCGGANKTKQPELDTRTLEIINKGGLKFKDHNKNGKLDPYEDWRLTAEERAADLASMMTLEEKAGLMHISSERRLGRGGPFGNVGPEPAADATKIVPEDPFPASIDYVNNRHLHFLIIRDNIPASGLASRNNKYQELAEQTRLGIPIVFTSNPRNHAGNIEFGITEASGQFSLWPGTLGLAAADDSSMIRQFAEIARKEWRASGIRKIYGYQVDVATEPRWRRISGTFGESPDLSARYSYALVRGFQGKTINNESVVHTIKHFPGDGPVYLGLDPHFIEGQWAVYPTEGSLFKYHLPPFQAAFDAGVSSLMSYYNRPYNEMSVPQYKGTLFESVAGAYNKGIIGDLARELGFLGYVNTDSGILSNTAWGVADLSLEERYAKAVKAGSAIFSDYNDPKGLINAVKNGLLTEEELIPAVEALLKEIFALGLFENPYVDPEEAQRVARDPASQALADEAHRKSVVLLRNSGILPLAENKKVYIEIFNGNRSEATTAAFRELVGKSVQVVDKPTEADAALIWVMPSTFQISAEKGMSICLNKDTGIDVAKIRSIESKVPTILIINLVNPWVINEIEPQASAVLATFGIKGEALLDVVYGRFNPVGKLPLTIPKDQEAVEKNASDVPGYAEDFDYAYTNSDGNKYVFGFGINY